MMRGWITHTTQSLIESGILEIGDGYRAKNSEMGSSGMPFVRAGDVNGRVNTLGVDLLAPEGVAKVGRKRSMPGDVVMTTKGTIGRLAFVKADDPEFVYSPQLCFWRSLDREQIEPRWLFYAMSSPEMLDQISWSAGQTDMAPYVSLTDQRTAFKLTMPPLSEQREIAAILGALDDKIELNRRTAMTLEEMARALYRSWFVDFDPVWAKAEGRTPAHMDEATAALFPDSLGDDGLPMGWELTSIGEVGEIVGGSTPSTKRAEFWEGGENLWATPKDLSGLKQPVLLQTERQVTDLGLAQISSGLSPEGTLLLSSRAPIGYLAIAQAPVAVNQGFIAIRETEELSGVEAFCWCHENMDAIHANANGSTFQEISKKNFRPLPYILAPAPIRAAFNQQAGAFFARLQSACAENQTLATLRDTLLPKLMSGELRVGEAQEMGEAAE